ncbi:carbamoyltransferase HypF [Bradyrhizobium sp. B097]|uniref:carbamoyltransferase HypF n=1 Tax=Bradyrhizobium sp. B097 TaxID=3140244 RepID=UPI0031843760
MVTPRSIEETTPLDRESVHIRSEDNVDPPLSWQLQVFGLVQGVGFRPFVVRQARSLGLRGFVRNCSASVDILLHGCSHALVAQFVATLQDKAPNLARIDRISVMASSPDPSCDSFEVAHSEQMDERRLTISPDVAPCKECLAEMRTPSDRRYGYPFINCVNCGPRFSIIRDLPYDRRVTTMSGFEQCPQCRAEYELVADRRYHAQPNACAKCGPRLTLYDRGGQVVAGDPLVAVVDALNAGRIVAVKGAGGFHLVVDAGNATAVAELRRRKRRDLKPFALMAADLETARRHAIIAPDEARLLDHWASPIVLMPRHPNSPLPDNIAPNNSTLGIMLPSTPLHHLMFDRGAPPIVVATSGNISGRPIVIDNATALAELPVVADLILTHNRDIEVRVDDSVLRRLPADKDNQNELLFLRRGRGYAPYAFDLHGVTDTAPTVLALGAELKTALAIYARGQIIVSQHIGDLKNDETLGSHYTLQKHLTRLLKSAPQIVACDLHPNFRSTQMALQESGRALVQVQHHHAHMACCMTENRIEGPALGVIFDGAGLGEDGSIWGAEFLVGDLCAVRQVGSIRSLRLLGGDRAVREPRRTALALLLDAYEGDLSACAALPVIAEFTPDELRVLTAMYCKDVHSPLCTSMGRLFDGVAALGGIAYRAEYEAQGPIELEGLLRRDFEMTEPYPVVFEDTAGVLRFDYRAMIRAIAHEVLGHRPAADISRRFHSTLVEMVIQMCKLLRQLHAFNAIVLSGGVFCNEFLAVNVLHALRDAGFAVYRHSVFPPNDGGIAVGQVAVALRRHLTLQASADATVNVK